MRLFYYELYRNSKREDKLGVEYTSHVSLLRESDIATIHAPLTRETEKLIDEKEIFLMKNRAR